MSQRIQMAFLHAIQMLYAVPRPLPPGDTAMEADSAPKPLARRLEGGVAPEVVWAPLLGLLALCAMVALVLVLYRRASLDQADEAPGVR